MSTSIGILELSNRADGRLRQLTDTYDATPSDPVVPAKAIERFDLRPGLEIEVELGKPMGGAASNNGSGGGGGGKQRGRRGKKKTTQAKRHRPRRPAGQSNPEDRRPGTGRVRQTVA